MSLSSSRASSAGEKDGRGAAGHDAEVLRQFSAQAAHFGRQGLTLSSAEYLNWVVAQLPAPRGERVLDVAAGTGHLGRALAPVAGTVFAVDLTPAMIAEGRREAAKAGIVNLAYVQGKAERLPLESGSFGMVVTRLSLHHFADPSPGLTEMARVCHEGGRIAVMDMVSPDDSALIGVYNDMERLRDPSHTRCLTLAELKTAVETAGFCLTSVAAREIEVKLEPWMEMTGTPEETRRVLRAALQADLVGGPSSGMRPFLRDGALMFTQTWATAVAQR